MKKIVLIEDDQDLYSLIQYNLEKEGFAMAGSQTGKGALDLCRRERPDLVILDIMLPDSDGLEICKAIRAHQELVHIPVIFLTARASETDRIVGLELGANDYIVKPFFVRELIARIKIHFRGQPPVSKLLKSGDLELDRARCRVHLAGQEVSLTATEFRLLEFLMSRPGVVFSREQLLDAVWGHDRAVTDRTVDVYILRLRQKIESDESAAFIRSVRGFGYSFNSEVPEGSIRSAVTAD
jgi:two-component system phosphate regulon response regulator PhoB